ncbi:MAG: PAS domain S-box protein [Desulfuromonadales bacterium]|nr:PAS domain S-box protein [Desulfuromonadales bacterium]
MRLAFDLEQIGAWSFDFTTGQLQWDDRSGAFFSLPADRPISSKEVLSRIHPEDLRALENNFQAGLNTFSDRDYQMEFRVIWPDGSVHNLLGRGRIFFSKDGLHQPAHILGTFFDQTISPNAELDHEQSLKSFQDLVETVNDWVWEVNQDGVYTYASPRVKNLLGYEPEEVIGKTPFDFMLESEKNRVANEFKRLLTMRESFLALENTNRHKDGHLVVLETSGVPYFDERGTLLGYRGIDRDISERKRAQEALIQANLELDAFVYTVSHDLRSYLTPIIGYAGVLKETCQERLDNQSLGCLVEIENQGYRMLELMEDLLILAKVGHLPRSTEPVDLNEVVADVLADMGSLIVQAGVITEQHPMPKLRVPKSLLTQIFYNLLGNAIRYAGSDGNPIEIGGERRGDLVSLYVRDHGPGIPESERSRIFEVFYRGVAGRKTSGTGVGLATVQKISRLYGGRAWVEKTPGGGSSFWVELMDIQNPRE